MLIVSLSSCLLQWEQANILQWSLLENVQWTRYAWMVWLDFKTSGDSWIGDPISNVIKMDLYLCWLSVINSCWTLYRKMSILLLVSMSVRQIMATALQYLVVAIVCWQSIQSCHLYISKQLVLHTADSGR